MSQLDKLKDKFKSCNDVPVSSIRVSIAEFERLLAEIDSPREYFCYDSDDGITFCETLDKALAYANGCLNHRDSWAEEVSDILVGAVTHRATQCGLTYLSGEVNEDGEDEEGEYWGDFKYRCNYKML